MKCWVEEEGQEGYGVKNDAEEAGAQCHIGDVFVSAEKKARSCLKMARGER